jgi:hypothetical protein
MSVEIRIELDESAIAKLRRIPILLRLGPAERTLKAMAKPVLERAKAYVPDSRKPSNTSRDGIPTKDKQSANTKKKWPEHAKNNLGFVYRKTDDGGYLVIGGKSPKANSLNFDSSKKGRKVMYWGKDAGRVKRVPPSERFMQRAFDETKSAQHTAGFNQLEKELRELNLG